MYKTPTRHKTINQRKKLSDVEKIKLFLRNNAYSLSDNMKEKSHTIHNLLKKRPVSSIGATLITGLLAGIFIGFHINK